MNEYVNKILKLFRKTAKSENTIQDFHEWLINDEQADEKEEALHHLWNEPNQISEAETKKALIQFKSKFNSKNTKTKHLVLWRYAAAIVAIVCITTAYILTNNPVGEVNFVESYSLIGEVRIITLPDGSIVKTNSSSILVYPEDFGQKSRTIYLTGEANFQVIKNAKIPFIVKSKNFSVTALGTEFNVSSYPNDNYYRTTLLEGSIKIENSEEEIAHILEVEDQFLYNKETTEYSIEKANVEDVTAWQRGELVFREATLEEILKVLERQYGVIFHNNSKNTDIYNFKFQRNAPLEKVLDVMDNVSDDFNYKLVDDICYIY